MISPDYASKCEWLPVSRDELEAAILNGCNRRLCLDAANRVIVRFLEELKQKWIQTFERVDDIPNKRAAQHKLGSLAEFKNHPTKVQTLLSKREILSRFDKSLEELTGGRTPLTLGKGTWLSMLRGKAIFREVVNTCFEVRDAKGNSLQGEKARKQVARSLLRLPLDDQPEDFRQLYHLVDARLNAV